MIRTGKQYRDSIRMIARSTSVRSRAHGHPLSENPALSLEALAAEPLVLASVAGRPLSPVAHEFAGHCRAFFGVSHAHPST